MRIFYNNKTGQVVGTVDGFNDSLSEKVKIVPGGMNPEDIDQVQIGLGHELEQMARDLMDPRHELTIETLKFDLGAKKLKEFDEVEKKAHKEKKLKEKADYEAWLEANPPVNTMAELAKLKADVEKLKADKPPKQ